MAPESRAKERETVVNASTAPMYAPHRVHGGLNMHIGAAVGTGSWMGPPQGTRARSVGPIGVVSLEPDSLNPRARERERERLNLGGEGLDGWEGCREGRPVREAGRHQVERLQGPKLTENR